MHDRASAVAGAVTAQPIHMIYQENVADNRTKGMTYAALKAPLTRLDVESPFTDSPSLDGRIDHPARIFSGSRFVVPKHLLIVAFRVDTTLGGSGLTAFVARDPVLTDTKLPADSEWVV
jgi:hypothetical protein